MRESEIAALSLDVLDEFKARYPALSDKLEVFDCALYFRSNPDVARDASSIEDLIRHFCEFGHRECRLYAPGVTYRSLFQQAYPEFADRLARFDPAEYRRANLDVGDANSDERVFYEHFCNDGARTLRALRPDNGVIDRRAAVRRLTGRDVECEIRCYAHLFFPDASRAVVPYLRNLVALDGRLAIAFSDVTFGAREMEVFAETVRGEGSAAPDFLAAPAEGRDWGGFLRLWQAFPPPDEAAVFFVHSKKSLHMAPIAGEMWRNELLAPICGSYGAILSAVDKLKEGYSMVGAALHRTRNIGPSRQLIQELLPSLGLSCNIDETDFVGGTMFAIRGDVLNAFFRGISSAIDLNRRSAEARPSDGTMAHACERLIGYFAASRGKGIAWTI